MGIINLLSLSLIGVEQGAKNGLKNYQFMGIYLIKSGRLTKIGYSSNIKKRWSQYRLHNPTAKLIFSENKGSQEFEKQIHNHFKSKKYRGEWFKLSKQDQKDCIDYIKTNVKDSRKHDYKKLSKMSPIEWFQKKLFFLSGMESGKYPYIKLVEKKDVVYGISNVPRLRYCDSSEWGADDILFKANLKKAHEIQMLFEPHTEFDYYPFQIMWSEDVVWMDFYRAVEFLYKEAVKSEKWRNKNLSDS